MPKIFISYRRQDSAEVTKRLHGRLEGHFQPGSVFYDIDSIPPGVDFRKRLSGSVEQSDALLAVIGNSWLDAAFQEGPKQGQRRLDDPDDYVRIEIEAALSLGVPVIPVLVDGAFMPKGEALAPGMRDLAYRNAAEVRFGPEFNVHVDRLIHSLKDLIKDQQELWDGLERAKKVADEEPEISLNRARKVLERIVREVYERRIGEPTGTRSLEKIVERLVQEWYLPDKFDLDSLLATRNRAKGLTTAEAERALTQLTEVLEWYTEVEQPDGVGQLPAPKRQPEPTSTKTADRSPTTRITVVPKGLRSFDAKDAKFFLELLPGPRDEEGLPESIRFWKYRIESTDELTFTVGVIYGPSGCGKSSLMKAGLLPRLSDNVASIYVETTAADTESRLLKGLRRHCTQLSANLDLMDTIAALRQGQALGKGQKLLIVLDQFEQWLHAKPQPENAELVRALRQCDGERVQTIVMVRDDFWVALSRFMSCLQIELVEGQNMALVDLFDLRHAKKVLTAFGRAFGALPDVLAKDQESFLDKAVEGLAQDGRVISVRLALFADMMKSKPWTLASLKAVGGTEGVGVTFLEETFSAANATPNHRLHQKGARVVLKTLLPEQGTDIKGNMRSRQELMEASGYADRPTAFDELIRILDNDVRLITPTDPEGLSGEGSEASLDAQNSPGTREGQPSGSKGPAIRHYQLTHDYLVPSLRAWLTRKQKETRRGRAELRLAERAAVWNAKSENRQLPSIWEYFNVRLLTDGKKWTAPQRKMMSRAARVLGIRSCLVGLAILIAAAIGLAVNARLQFRENSNFASARVEALLAAKTADVGHLLGQLDKYHGWAVPFLKDVIDSKDRTAKEKLHARLALIKEDPSQAESVLDALLDARVEELPVIITSLKPHKKLVEQRLWQTVMGGASGPRLHAAAALVAYDPENVAWQKVRADVVTGLVSVAAADSKSWIHRFRAIGGVLTAPLEDCFKDRNPMHASERSQAAAALADFLKDDPQKLMELILLADNGAEFAPFLDALRAHRAACVDKFHTLVNRAARLDPEDVRDAFWRKPANAAVCLFGLGDLEAVWPLLRHSENPSLRSFIVDRLARFGADTTPLISRLGQEEDPSTRQALILALGDFDPGKFSSQERQALVEHLQGLYRRDADAGVHSAAGWTLRRYQAAEAVKRLDAEFQKTTKTSDSEKRRWFINSQGQTFVVVDGPTDVRTGDAREKASPPKSVNIGRRFAVATCEVTVEQFEKFRHQYNPYRAYAPQPDCPANNVSWYDAAAYCNWLSAQEGIPKNQWCYEPNKKGEYAEGMTIPAESLQRTGYRLPAEVEWEYVCRANTTTSFCFGQPEELLSRYAWYLDNSQQASQPIGRLKPNALGLFDVHGNVYEWCQDRGDGGDRLGNETVKSGDSRVERSGAFNDRPSDVRSANREMKVANTRSFRIGFRPARTCR
jgi:eukaryotic-like serine/threonine-protein kinase